ncbi:MAG: hypothetical protein Q8934_17215 [Bacillota bacterium]|nr:hypothetical protein [Bacillota bacterium]
MNLHKLLEILDWFFIILGGLQIFWFIKVIREGKRTEEEIEKNIDCTYWAVLVGIITLFSDIF